MTDAIRSALEAARAQLINLNDAIDDFWNDPTRPSVATMRSGTVSNLSIAQLDARASLAKIDAALASLDAPQPDALREAENAVSHAFGLLSSAVRCGEAWRQELDDAKDRARAEQAERERDERREIARKWFDECFAAKSALSASEARVKELQHAAMNACAAMRGVVAIEKKNEFAVVRHALAALRQALEGDGRAVLRKEGK